MSSVLEEKLEKLQNDIPADNRDLSYMLRKIISEEEKLPYEERNFELIDEAIENLLTLESADISELDKKASDIKNSFFEKIHHNKPFGHKKSKNKTNLKKIIIIAASVAVLLALLIIPAVSYWNDLEYRDLRDGLVLSMEPNKLYKRGNEEIIYTYDISEYNSIEEMLENESLENIILPDKFFNSFNIDSISVDNYDCDDYKVKKSIIIIMSVNDSKVVYKISIPHFQKFSSNLEYIEFDDLKIYTCEIDTVWQFNFQYDENDYCILIESESLSKAFYENLKNGIKS